MHATLTSKGQVTLPKALRERLRLEAGDRIEFVMEGNDVVRILSKTRSVARLKGALPKPDKAVSLDEMEEAIRRHAHSGR